MQIELKQNEVSNLKVSDFFLEQTNYRLQTIKIPSFPLRLPLLSLVGVALANTVLYYNKRSSLSILYGEEAHYLLRTFRLLGFHSIIIEELKKV